jgi:hypothetical protein
MSVIKNRQYNITKGMSQTEKDMGVDLEINADGDLKMSNLKDLKLVAGVNNAAQALRLKLEVEKGSLPYHPAIGTQLQIGEKTKDAFTIKTSVLNSILLDPRFASARVTVTVSGGIYILDIAVVLKNTDNEVPLQLALVN